MEADQSAMRNKRIPLYQPDLSGNERRYVSECVESSWISSLGSFVGRFESAIAAATGAPHAIAVCNGTVALHLALHCLGIGVGDEVIVPTFTYIASVNTITQTGATAIFAESRSGDWLLDTVDVERLITPRTKAIMPVHLYGVPCDMPALMRLAEQHGLKVIEDCAEALGTCLNGRHVGTFGDVGTFSFFGNKTITTGEGGAVIANNEALAARLRMTKGQGQSLTRRYWHEVLGFNYRMTNIAAAIGTAQMERFEEILARKRQIATTYRRLLEHSFVQFQEEPSCSVCSNWLVTVLLPQDVDRDQVISTMAGEGIETRPTFYCAHQMPMYASAPEGWNKFLVAQNLASRGISLPSYPSLSSEDLIRAVNALKLAITRQRTSSSHAPGSSKPLPLSVIHAVSR
jgi:perosamine synthetase